MSFLPPPSRVPRPEGIKRVEQPERPPPRPSHPRQFPEKHTDVSKTHELRLGHKQTVYDATSGIPYRYRTSHEYDPVQSGGLKRIESQKVRRNGIPLPSKGSDNLIVNPVYDLNFFKNKINGGGFIPGSNFGLSGPTQSSASSQHVFGNRITSPEEGSRKLPSVMQETLGLLDDPKCLCAPGLLSMVPLHAVLPTKTLVHAHVQSVDPRRAAQVLRLRGRFDAHKCKELSPETDLVVAFTVLYTYLAEMTPPLLTFEKYERLLASQQYPLLDAKKTSMRSAILTLRPLNRKALGSLITYWSSLIDASLAAKQAESESPPAPTGLNPNMSYRSIKLPQSPAAWTMRHTCDSYTLNDIAIAFAPVLLRHDPHKPKRDMDMSDDAERVLKTEVLAFMILHRNDLFQVSDLVSAGKSRRRCRVPYLAKQAILHLSAMEQSVKELGLWEYRVRQMLSANESKTDDTIEEKHQEDKEEMENDRIRADRGGDMDADLSDEEEDSRLAAEVRSNDGSLAVLASIRDEEADKFIEELSNISKALGGSEDANDNATGTRQTTEMDDDETY